MTALGAPDCKGCEWEIDFDGNALPSTIWHVGELWWYGLAKVFFCNCDVDYRKEDGSIFRMEGRSSGSKGFMGARFPWCSKDFHGSYYHRPSYCLEKGYIYKFIIGMDEKPDLVLLDNKLLWDREDGIYNEKRYLEFFYVPSEEKEEVELSILKYVDGEKGKSANLNFSRSPYFERPKMKCSRAKYQGNAPSYKTFDFPSETEFRKIDPEIACSRLEKHNSLSVEYQAEKVVEPPYENSRIKFFASGNGNGEARVPFILDYAEKCGFDIFDANYKILEDSGLEHIGEIKKRGMDIMIIPSVSLGDGKYMSEHWVRFLENGELDEARKGTIELIRQCLEINPDFTVYLMYPEFSSIFGHWSGSVEHSPMKSLPCFKGRSFDNHVDAFLGICEYWQKTTEEIKKHFPEGKVKVYTLYSGGLHGALFAKLGSDILMNKHIHRRNQNIVVSNARGVAEAYGLEYGFDNDCWNRCYVCDYTPEEARQNLMVYYFSGAQYIYPEMMTASRDEDAFTDIGKEWVEFVKYCKLHSSLGKQKVKIAVMRGLPDEWNRFASPSGSWEAAKDGNEVIAREYYKEYNLLNLFFPNYGLYYRTFTDRLCTGTPYGPVDFVPWDAPAEKLKDYELIVFLGKSNCMTPDIYGNLKEYVTDGGTLFAALGQFKDKKGELLKTDLSDFAGVESQGEFTLKADPVWDREDSLDWKFPDGKQIYPMIKLASDTARTVYRFKNSDPYVTENRVGKGRVYLFAGEYLSEHDSFTPARLIQPVLEKAKWLDFEPQSDWLEYMTLKKGSCYLIPIFNHGNVGFPSGNGRKCGVWEGRVLLDLEKFDFMNGDDLCVCESVYSPDGKMPFELRPAPSVLKNGKLSFDAKVDRFSEFVIGSREKLEKEYFSQAGK